MSYYFCQYQEPENGNKILKEELNQQRNVSNSANGSSEENSASCHLLNQLEAATEEVEILKEQQIWFKSQLLTAEKKIEAMKDKVKGSTQLVIHLLWMSCDLL